MKQNLGILKDLQEYERKGVTVGHCTAQSSQRQEVANINHAGERPETDIQKTEAVKNLYRISTEPGTASDRLTITPGKSVVPMKPFDMPPALAEIAAAWPRLPEAIKAGMIAMVKAAIPDN